VLGALKPSKAPLASVANMGPATGIRLISGARMAPNPDLPLEGGPNCRMTASGLGISAKSSSVKPAACIMSMPSRNPGCSGSSS
jgi:hypothetical protein